jgi:polar amino acid transport system substrate-binding protein
MGLSRRQFLSSTTLFGAAVVAGCSTRVSGEATANPADVRRAKESAKPPVPDVVTVGIISFEPYTEGSGSDLKGPIPDVARKVLTGIGVQNVKFEIMAEQDKVLTALVAGAIDMAGGLSPGPNYCHGLKFSEPDFVSGTSFAVPAGNPKGIRTFADVAAQGAKVGVLLGAPEKEDAQAGGTGSIVEMPDPTALLRAVASGQVDCFAFDDLSLHHMVKTMGQGVEATAPFMPEHRLPYVGAYAFPEDTALLDPFNDALKELHESGEWLRMVKPFEFTEDNQPPADLTAAKACAG